MTGPGDDELDTDLLLAVVRASPDTRELLRWAVVARDLEQDGRLTYPLREVEDLDPLFAAARKRFGVSQSEADHYRRSIPPSAFPVGSFEELLREALVIMDIVHRLPTPREVPRKMR